ncbi:MAG: leishmanolysin-related zinc metalloendopeptidase, partial [Limisphaerales bacterium]
AATAFTIDVRFQGGLNQAQKNAFRAAANRWTKVITGALPPVNVDGELVTGVVILAQGAPIDGPGGVLGQAGPTRLRPANAGAAAFLPAKGEMTFDNADLAAMEQDGTLGDVIAHEMGHVIGIGTIWDLKGVLHGAGTSNPTFTGQNAMRECGLLKTPNEPPTPVPIEHLGGAGTADSHWRDSVFRNELMTGFVNPTGGNPLSRVTVGSLADLGYQVDLTAAEPFILPNVALLAAAGGLGPMAGAVDMHKVLPIIPMVLPPAALVQ